VCLNEIRNFHADEYENCNVTCYLGYTEKETGAEGSLETSATIYQTTRRHMSEDHNLNIITEHTSQSFDTHEVDTVMETLRNLRKKFELATLKEFQLETLKVLLPFAFIL
jgi:sugar diacid utilization regulator